MDLSARNPSAAGQNILSTTADNRQVFRFGAGGNGLQLLRYGWCEPEKGFVWTSGRCAELTIDLESGAHVLALSIWGYVPNERGPQDLLLFAEGKLSGYYEVDEKTVISVALSLDTPKQISLALYLPTAVSPLQAENAPDSRQLSIALATLQISAS